MTDADFKELKIAELMAERYRLHEAILRAREALEQGRADTAHTILGAALGFTSTAREDDFEAQRRLAVESGERD